MPLARTSVVLLALAAYGCAPEAEPPADAPSARTSAELSVHEPWARPAPLGGTSAAYFTLIGGAQADTLRATRTPAAEVVELHEAFERDGLRGMRAVPAIPVAAGDSAALQPGGLHVMLIRATRVLEAGDSLTLELEFARSEAQRVRVPVRPLGASSDVR